MTTNAAPLTRPADFVPFRTPVRGHAFAPRPPRAGDLAPGQPVSLLREPRNPADRYAVAVWISTSGTPWRIGYLTREVAARLAPRLDAGDEVEARVDGWLQAPSGRWKRPVLAVFPTPERYHPAPAGAPVAREQPGSPPLAARDQLPTRPARSVRRRVSMSPDR